MRRAVAADRLSIVSTTIDPLTLLPVLTGLNAQDNNGTATGNLVINANGGTITVTGHFTGNTQTGIELINFNNATYRRLSARCGGLSGQPCRSAGNRDAGGVNLSASLANNFIVGEQGPTTRSPAASATT